MNQALRKGRVLFTAWLAHMSAYRAEIVIWLLSGGVPLIMLAVWIGKARANGGTSGGYTPQGFAAYFLAAWITQQFIVAWVAWEVDSQIRLGTFSSKLLRPLDPLWEHALSHIAERVVRLPFMVLIVGAGLLLVPGTRLTPDLWHVLLYFISVNLAFAVRFLICYCTGLLAFWFDQATAIDELYFVVAAFLTGSFAPLSFYPASVQAVIAWTPFPYFLYYPVQILNGAVDGPETARIIAVQLFWVGVMVLIWRVLWQRGLRRYGAVGA